MSYKKLTMAVSSCKPPQTNNKVVSITSAKTKPSSRERSKEEAIAKCIRYAETLDW